MDLKSCYRGKNQPQLIKVEVRIVIKRVFGLGEADGMIACVWRCMTQSSSAENYLNYLIRDVFPAYRSATGNRGFFVLNDINEDLAYFLLLSFWESNKAFVNFVSQDSENSLSHPEKEDYLVAYESRIKKYQVVDLRYDT
jgi:heme-degrading monooxygenase HmoA